MRKFLIKFLLSTAMNNKNGKYVPINSKSKCEKKELILGE